VGAVQGVGVGKETSVSVMPGTGGLQRIFLAHSGGGPAQVEKKLQKMSLGPTKGGVARLAEPIDGKPLLVGEGTMTVFTAMQAVDLPGWETFGVGNLRDFNPPDDVKWVVALAENLDGGTDGKARTNKRALESMVPRLIGAGSERIMLARELGGSYGRRGALADWQGGVGALAKHHALLRFTISTRSRALCLLLAGLSPAVSISLAARLRARRHAYARVRAFGVQALTAAT
jgi:hypothetical protein